MLKGRQVADRGRTSSVLPKVSTHSALFWGLMRLIGEPAQLSVATKFGQRVRRNARLQDSEVETVLRGGV